MPALSVERLTILVYASLAACVVLVIAVAALGVRLGRIRRSYARLLDAPGRGDLLSVVSRQIEAVELLRGKLDLIGREAAELRQRVSGAVRTVGLARYDAYPDIGGQLSFSAAMLDEAGDGIVLSTINGRSDSRSYAKQVRGGRSEHQLSEEERAAIALAMGETRPVARSHA